MLFDFYNSFEGCQTQKLIVADMYISRELYACKTYRQYINVLLSVFVSWMTFIFSNFHWLTKQLFSYRFILFARFWRGEMNICSYYQYTFYTWKLFSYLSLDRIKQTFYLIRQMFAKKRDIINSSWNINYYFACWNLPFSSVKLT